MYRLFPKNAFLQRRRKYTGVEYDTIFWEWNIQGAVHYEQICGEQVCVSAA